MIILLIGVVIATILWLAGHWILALITLWIFGKDRKK